MISRLTGHLEALEEDVALVSVGGLVYEVLLPSGTAQRLSDTGAVGESITFQTIYYIEAGDRKSAHYPKLVGFTTAVDREFFAHLINVSGMGIRKALRALVLPIREVATAIETEDSSTLSKLPGVGGRLAGKMIAELQGKVTKFALSKSDEPLSIKRKPVKPVAAIADDAIDVLTQLQYRRDEAEEMVARVLADNPDLTKVEDIIQTIFRSAGAPKTLTS